jgi:hypothetical protein
MDAVTYPDPRVVDFISQHMIAVRVNTSSSDPLLRRFPFQYTPTEIVLDGDGMERHRTVGFHPPEEFIPELMLGIAQALVHSGNFSQALAYLDKILLNYSASRASSQARQLRQVCLSKGAGR